MPKEEDKKTLPPKEKSDTNRAAIRKFVSDYVRPIKKMIDASLYDALQSGVLSYAAAEQLIKLNEKEKRTELLEFAVSHTLAELSAEVKRLNGEVKEKVKAERDKFAQKMRGLTRASLETLSAARKKRALSLMGQLERVLYEEQESEQSEQSEDQS